MLPPRRMPTPKQEAIAELAEAMCSAKKQTMPALAEFQELRNEAQRTMSCFRDVAPQS
jgi:molecular chaperone GrpE (heat shock protein)